MYSLNVTKRQMGPLVLPLIAECVRLRENTDFASWKSRISWCYNALFNATILSTVFKTRGSHQKRVDRWSKLDPTELGHMLTAMRTGTMSSTLEGAIADALKEPIFSPLSRYLKPAIRAHFSMSTLKKIAARYGLSSVEFNYFLTIPTFGRSLLLPISRPL